MGHGPRFQQAKSLLPSPKPAATALEPFWATASNIRLLCRRFRLERKAPQPLPFKLLRWLNTQVAAPRAAESSKGPQQCTVVGGREAWQRARWLNLKMSTGREEMQTPGLRVARMLESVMA